MVSHYVWRRQASAASEEAVYEVSILGGGEKVVCEVSSLFVISYIYPATRAAAVGFTGISNVLSPPDNPPQNHAASCRQVGFQFSFLLVPPKMKERKKRTKRKVCISNMKGQSILRETKCLV